VPAFLKPDQDKVLMRHLLNHLRPLTWMGHLSKWINSRAQSSWLIQDPAITKNVYLLEKRFKGAMQFLKNTRVHKNGMPIKLNYLPWYLIVGSAGSGKTTLLAHSTIHFILEKKFNQDTTYALPPTEACDWWVTHEMVFVDVPGRYWVAKNKKNVVYNKLWNHFLTLTKKYRGKKAIDGVIVTLALDELMQPAEREILLRRLSARINELKKYVGPHVPFYFMLTKCDLLPGFTDFFGDCSQEELHQAWGVSLAATLTESFAELLTQRFNALIKRLNEQLIWRLHQEHNPYAKVFIKDFPLQVERLKEALLDFFKSLLHSVDNIGVKGVFLSSATQQTRLQNQNELYPETLPSQALSQTFEIMRAPQTKNYPYFIKQFLLHGLAKPASYRTFAVVQKQLAAAYIFTFSAAIISMVLLGNYIYHQQEPVKVALMQTPNTTLTLLSSKKDNV
jgi:type VI protein secretion system component VasK